MPPCSCHAQINLTFLIQCKSIRSQRMYTVTRNEAMAVLNKMTFEDPDNYLYRQLMTNHRRRALGTESPLVA